MATKYINKLYDDYQIGAQLRTTGPNQPTLAAFNGTAIYVYQFSLNDEAFFPEVQLPHTWDLGVIYPHVHWTPSGAIAAGSLTWSMDYSWANPHPATAWSASATVSGTFNTTSSAYVSQLTGLGAGLSLAGATISALLCIRLYLSANTTGQDPFLDAFDLHFAKARQGSINIATLP